MIDLSAAASDATTRRLLRDVLMGVLAVLTPAIWIISELTVVWPWVGYGVGSIVVGYAVSWTAVGYRIGAWFTRISSGGRFLCIVVAAVCIWGGIWTTDPDVPSMMSFVCGGASLLLGISVVRLCNRVVAGY
ncbi:hypothetical protein [Halocatena pleomorpha]|uniref:Uncharacterized protein n=1 Tax=Halocatena pleomorpha TaxID=1785090 RepID=A0A3P3RJX5_9EURY|nr:hypothetical protein [Halocatena pleomorpha]RRJ33119.1 hypothetical protein EIK79_03585 [Halocatena pleomorpha]